MGSRALWTVNETNQLLSLLKEREILNKLDGKEYRHNYLMTVLSGDMRLHEYDKTAEQIKTRLKTLKDKYKKIKGNLGVSGAEGVGKIEWEYFEAMDELYGCRPSTTRKGVDSAKKQIISEAKKDEIESVTSSNEPTILTSSDVSESDDLISAEKLDVVASNLKTTDVINDNRSAGDSEETEVSNITENLQTVEKMGDTESLEGEIETLLRKPLLSTEGSFSFSRNSTKEQPLRAGQSSQQNFENSLKHNVSDDNLEEPSAVKRKKRLRNLDKEKKDVLENLDKKRVENTKMLLENQERIQKESIEAWKPIMQQNSLLLIQALGMINNSSRGQSTCQCSSSVGSSFGASVPPYMQNSFYNPFLFREPVSTGSYVPMSVPIPQNPNYFYSQVSDRNQPLYATVPNSSFVPEGMATSFSPQGVSQPYVNNFNHQNITSPTDSLNSVNNHSMNDSINSNAEVTKGIPVPLESTENPKRFDEQEYSLLDL